MIRYGKKKNPQELADRVKMKTGAISTEYWGGPFLLPKKRCTSEDVKKLPTLLMCQTPHPLSPSSFSLQAYPLYLDRVWLPRAKWISLQFYINNVKAHDQQLAVDHPRAPSHNQGKQTRLAPYGSISEIQVTLIHTSHIICSTPWIPNPWVKQKHFSY